MRWYERWTPRQQRSNSGAVFVGERDKVIITSLISKFSFFSMCDLDVVVMKEMGVLYPDTSMIGHLDLTGQRTNEASALDG